MTAPKSLAQVEDFLRLRREAFGKLSGNVDVPPVVTTPKAAADVAVPEQYAAFKTYGAWAASLAVNEVISAVGGRGCSLEDHDA